jgi:hypothetical protein
LGLSAANVDQMFAHLHAVASISGSHRGKGSHAVAVGFEYAVCAHACTLFATHAAHIHIAPRPLPPLVSLAGVRGGQ